MTQKRIRLRKSDRLRSQLLRGASVVAIVTALSHAQASAQTLSALRANSAISNAAIAARFPNGLPAQPLQHGGSTNPSNSTGMAGASLRALQYQARVAQGVDLATQAQEAARAAAAALQSSVPDGLGIGGLDPVSNPVKAADDTTGVHTWDGADAPTQTTGDAGTKVTVHQTQSRAILSWQTFNVGKKTSLTFDQSAGGTSASSWVVLNRVVGQLDPLTGLRTGAAPAPSQILGSISAPGTVMVLNQNGILFSGTSQINTNSFIATSLEIGRMTDENKVPLTIAQRNNEFLTYGILGYADQAPSDQQAVAYTFSAQEYTDKDTGLVVLDRIEGALDVQAGAQITSGVGGAVLLVGPKITNSGTLTSLAGQVSLQSGRTATLIRSTGSADGASPDVRGFTLNSSNSTDKVDLDYVQNTAQGIINAPQGYISLGATADGAILEGGALTATTSVSRNGYIQLTGADIQIGIGATMAIGPDTGEQTIPQDPTSLSDFKPSRMSIGTDSSRIEIDQAAMLFAPGGNIDIGAAAGATGSSDTQGSGFSRIFIDSGATIDVAGLTDVTISNTRNQILISPVKGNELRDDPNYRESFLNGATFLVDPRISGVDANGVEWVGSPLISAASYAQQVGVTVQELMTKGGNVVLGVQSKSGADAALAPDVTVKSGATIDFSGGWVTYEAGFVRTTELISASGQIVDVGDADMNGSYVAVYSGFTQTQARWGIERTFSSPLLNGGHYEAAYNEGRDAGSLTAKGSTIVLDGTLFGNAYAGTLQIAGADKGTAASAVYVDYRHLQGAPSQLPSGGFLFVQGLVQDPSGNGTFSGAGDIEVVSGANYHPVDPSLAYGQSVSIGADGSLIVPATRDPNSYLPTDRADTISLSADSLSNVGLSAVSLETSGRLGVAADASVNLQAGGAFYAVAGRTITIDGKISVPSGTIQMQTINAGLGSAFDAMDGPASGSYDIDVNGTLTTRGRWSNDFGADADHLLGSAYTDGGSVVLISAPRQTLGTEVQIPNDGQGPTSTDISGSILLNAGSVVDVSAGGYVGDRGALSLTARGAISA